MNAHIFVDESKGRNYLVAAAEVPANMLTLARKQMYALCKPGQRRIHFTNEGDRRRRELLAVISSLEPRVVLYDGARYGKIIGPRDAPAWWLYAQVRSIDCEETLQYVHKRAHEDALLAVPDAVAWSWIRGGGWKRRVKPLVEAVRSV